MGEQFRPAKHRLNRMKIRVKNQLKAALKEDIGRGDVTSNLLIPAKANGKAMIVAKASGVFAGEEVVRMLFEISDSKMKVRFHVKDGQKFRKNQTLLELQGNVRSILKVERTMLNLLQHLCGIATQAKEFVKRAGKVKILDTRKTTPLWRDLEKYAVKCGGGFNHRMGLYDAVFVKENHRPYGNLRKLKTGFEIEVRNIRELMEALMLQPAVILFDNFKPSELKMAVEIARTANKKVKLEASGGVTLENISSYARTGVDQISIGSLTHSVKAIDLSLLL